MTLDIISTLIGGCLVFVLYEWRGISVIPTITVDGLNGKVYHGVSMDTLDAVHTEIRRDVVRMQLGRTRDRILARQFRKTTE